MEVPAPTTENGDPRVVELTEEARMRIRAALAAADPPRRWLRVRVTPRGHDFDYQLQGLAEDQVREDDLRLPEDGFTLVVVALAHAGGVREWTRRYDLNLDEGWEFIATMALDSLRRHLLGQE